MMPYDNEANLGTSFPPQDLRTVSLSIITWTL